MAPLKNVAVFKRVWPNRDYEQVISWILAYLAVVF